MTNVTITPIKPSEQLIKSAVKEVVVDDALGRKITLRKPGPLANLDFAKAAGGSELNMLYLAEVAHLKFVSAIDGEPVPTPASKRSCVRCTNAWAKRATKPRSVVWRPASSTLPPRSPS